MLKRRSRRIANDYGNGAGSIETLTDRRKPGGKLFPQSAALHEFP